MVQLEVDVSLEVSASTYSTSDEQTTELLKRRVAGARGIRTHENEKTTPGTPAEAVFHRASERIYATQGGLGWSGWTDTRRKQEKKKSEPEVSRWS